MKIGMILSAAAICLAAGMLDAKEYGNILHYKKCGTWKSSASVIAGGTDAGRIDWNGKMLKFTPPGGVFDLKDIFSFGFAMRVPENMRNQRILVKFVYEEGKPLVWNVKTPPHVGWQGAVIPQIAGKKPSLRPGKIKTVTFISKVPGFQAVLDDIRFVPQGLNYQFEDAWVPPVTDGCFFPEYTLEQQRKETLDDPDFKAKMAEIEHLRQTKLKIRLKPQQTRELENKVLDRIRPDGSIEGLSYEDAVRINRVKRDWRPVNETFMHEHCSFYMELLRHWEFGKIARTEENRKKIFRSLIRTLTAESNRRMEFLRGIVPSFVLPSMTARAYQVFFDEMDAVEKGTSKDPDSIRLNRLLKEETSWCYFQGFTSTVGPTLTVRSFQGSSAWTGGNFSYRPTFRAALICRNPKMLEVISGVAERSLSVTSYNTMKSAFWLDGLTADGSAWGHRNQNYPFGYPLDGFAGIARLINYLAGTCWELKADGPAFDTLCNYFDALLWHGTGWAGNDSAIIQADQILQRDILAACGRRAMAYREGKGYADFGKPFRVAGFFLNVMPAASVHRKQLQQCADVMDGKIRKLPVGTRYFWNNDLLICREKDSLVPISMLSSRVLSIESAPNATHLTDFWSDGAAWIMKHFDSYRVGRGFMKPYAIPGVTSRQWEFTHKGQSWRSNPGLYNFAGGAADGNYAAAGYRMGRKKAANSPDPNFYGLTASKAYFWLNGKLVCLGAGITDETDRKVPVATTIDQTLWRGPAREASGEVHKPGETFRTDSQLLWHDGVGYSILKGKGILSGETRKGRWLDYHMANKQVKDLPKTAPMLQFQIDHGKNPKNDSYAYAVDFHCGSFADLRKNAENPQFEILALTPDLQAVREKSSGTLAAVFHKPGEVGGLKVSAPAVVLLRQNPDGTVTVTVNDPEQNPKRNSVTLTWNGKAHKIKLPVGVYCGQPVKADL
jgi:hypothetical protein